MSTFAPSTEISTNLLKQYQTIRSRSEVLCRPLSKEDYIPQPVPFVSPPKWHLAHTTWFFEAFILEKLQAGYQPFHRDFGFLFNSYYNAVGERLFRADRGNITRPGVDEVYAYRKSVDQAMQDLIEEGSTQQLDTLLTLGLHHEQQHQELLLTDLKYTLAHNPIFPIYQDSFSLVNQENVEAGMLEVDSGIYDIGFEGDGFHYDNERAKHQVYLHRYQISKALVSNGEFLAFISDGGYQRSELWLDEGWSWVQSQGITKPLYWHQVENKWHQYTLSGLRPIIEGEILAHINFYEASAYAEWKSMRLPTEFEWEVASGFLKWGTRWEWTGSSYLPYPGFDKAPGAIGEYNGKFMINQMVLRGSSSATSPGHSRKTYRNFFHPHLGWQCTGIRLASKQIF
ncbi:MAG: ergothioneine biosynthesis protein EgtB [Saprospiraceae bacterium]|nr:ergothioneine biosynthesis protein EgtB [Saprospiraceae bacterium]